MQIKIACTKDEFVDLLHRCFVTKELAENCPSCALYDFCGSKDGEGDSVAQIAEISLTEYAAE